MKIFWIPKISHFAYYKKINLVHSYTCNYRKLCQMHTFYRYYYSFFTFLYINRRKYWFLASFRLPVFDGFAHDLTISGKCLSVCVCDKNFVASVAIELSPEFYEIVYLVLSKRNLVSIKFW